MIEGLSNLGENPFVVGRVIELRGGLSIKVRATEKGVFRTPIGSLRSLDPVDRKSIALATKAARRFLQFRRQKAQK